VPRLSCVIPAVGTTQDLETTLVSVLEKRPDDCEIIVVLNKSYADPYGLKDEVRFVEMIGAGMAACATLGIQISDGEIVQVLAAGVEVADGWVEAALPHFDDPEVAAVTPVIRDAARPERVLAAGVRYHPGGQRGLCTKLPNTSARSGDALGPVIDAAFYRKSALAALGDGLPVNLGDGLADIDLALGLAHAGLRNVVEPECIVFAERLTPAERSGFRAGLFAERLFLRNLPVTGWLPAFALHGLTVVGELLRSLSSGTTLTQLAGRLTAWFTLSDYRLHHHLLRVAREIVERDASERAVIVKLPRETVAAGGSVELRTKRAG
jgi:Glycosyl transferase family 2